MEVIGDNFILYSNFYNLWILRKMNITFLSRFQGKTATISKLGIEDTLKGSNDTILYTNTYKSFGNMASRKFHVRKDS